MKTHVSKVALVLSALALFFISHPDPLKGQLIGIATGTAADTYVINDDDTPVDFASLRLQNNNNDGWNVANRFTPAGAVSNLAWTFDAGINPKNLGPVRMQIDQNGNFGVVAEGTIGTVASDNKWIQLAAKPPFPSSSAAYGQRIQWDTDMAVFSLKENGPRRDLVIQYGGNAAGNDLRFEYFDGTNPIEMMVVTDTGNVGIGTSAPAALLHLADKYGPDQGRLLQIGDDVFFTDTDHANITVLAGVQNEDRVGLELGIGGPLLFGINTRIGIQTTNPQSTLDVNGTAQFNGTVKPSATNTHSLGSAHERWSELFSTNGTINTSDRRDKENVAPLSYGLDEVLALEPINYTWIDRPDQGTQVGFIAQEANEIIPDVVFDPKEYTVQNEAGEWVSADLSDEARFGIRYAMLTPILVNAIQEQQAQIEELKAEIERTRAGGALKASEDSGSDALSVPRLYQNAPNPFDGKTNIRFYLPQQVQRATLNIYDMQGSPIQVIDLNERGQGSYLLDGSMLPAGMYLYALLADGQEIDVKRMVIQGQR